MDEQNPVSFKLLQDAFELAHSKSKIRLYPKVEKKNTKLLAKIEHINAKAKANARMDRRKL